MDAGIANGATRAAWEALLAAPPLSGGGVGRVVVTHHHPDHIGLAGWLCERTGAPLLTSRTAFLTATAFTEAPGLLEAEEFRRFYASHGMRPEAAALVATQGHAYLRMLSPLPRSYERLVAGDRLALGGRRWEVLSGDGHAPEQLMFLSGDLFLSADQVLERISPNVSLLAFEPKGDPLGEFLRSLDALAARVPEGALVLPGHRLPFRGLHERAAQLKAHHAARCDRIWEACDAPRTADDLVPVLFTRPLDPHETSFAFSEVLAHLARMVAQGRLRWEQEGGLRRVARA